MHLGCLLCLCLLSLAFSTAIPLGSCFDCFRREYSFLVLTLGGASRSYSSSFKPKMSFRYFSYALSIILRTRTVFDQGISSGRQVFLTLTSGCKV